MGGLDYVLKFSRETYNLSLEQFKKMREHTQQNWSLYEWKGKKEQLKFSPHTRGEHMALLTSWKPFQDLTFC